MFYIKMPFIALDVEKMAALRKFVAILQNTKNGFICQILSYILVTKWPNWVPLESTHFGYFMLVIYKHLCKIMSFYRFSLGPHIGNRECDEIGNLKKCITAAWQ